ncbi:PcfD [Streptococcus pneumoniae]|nr:PcfD [Streptococcus pneumoniae]
MSYYELHQQNLSDIRLVSMEGLKRSVVAYQTLRLIAEENQKLEFLDTVTPSKLLSLINTIRDTTSYFDNHPDLLTLAVDCDDAGKDFSDKLSRSGFPVLLDLPDNESGKEKRDWNDILQENKSDLKFMLENAKETLRNQPVRQTSQCLEL